MKITKAVFPVAGLGTRFLPATKATPKEMLPLINKPLIQYAVEEAVAAGITDIIFVTSNTKRAIEDHFDTNYELEQRLIQSGKETLLASVVNILPPHVQCFYVRQPEALGLGHAILSAERIIGDVPFAVLLADDYIETPDKNCLRQLIDLFSRCNGNVIAIEKIVPEMTDRYGVIEVDSSIDNYFSVKALIEKPGSIRAPSSFGVVGRYILHPSIFNKLKQITVGYGQEIQLTDGIQALLTNEKVYALPYRGTRYDCGTTEGYLKAILSIAGKDPVLRQIIIKSSKSL